VRQGARGIHGVGGIDRAGRECGQAGRRRHCRRPERRNEERTGGEQEAGWSRERKRENKGEVRQERKSRLRDASVDRRHDSLAYCLRPEQSGRQSIRMGNNPTAAGSSIPTATKHGHHITSSGADGDKLASCCSPRLTREKRNACVHVTTGTPDQKRNQDANTHRPRAHPSLQPCLLQRKLHRKVRDVQAYRHATKDGRPTSQLALRLVRVHTRGVQVLLRVPPKSYKPHPGRHESTSRGVVGPGFTQKAQNDQNSETVPHMHRSQHKPCQDRGTHTQGIAAFKNAQHTEPTRLHAEKRRVPAVTKARRCPRQAHHPQRTPHGTRTARHGPNGRNQLAKRT